jgi:hypothetical protein
LVNFQLDKTESQSPLGESIQLLVERLDAAANVVGMERITHAEEQGVKAPHVLGWTLLHDLELT